MGLLAGTGNLLANLTESHRLYASTLDKADVDIMQELQSKGTLHLLPKHIFQFDFLNDSFFDKPCSKHAIKQTNKEKDNKDLVNAENNKKAQTQNYETSINISNDFRGFANQECKDCKQSKLPKGLQEILKDEAKRKKLIIFINPPYAEAGTASQATGTGKNKSGVALNNAIYERYKDIMGKASNELFAQFFFRIYKEIPCCILASFATLKYVNSTNFIKFRETFRAEFLNGFICPSYTFDNVKGSFPISFIVWNLGKNDKLQDITLDVFDDKGESLGEKRVYNVLDTQNSLSKWIAQYGNKTPPPHLGTLFSFGPSFQSQGLVFIKHCIYAGHPLTFTITFTNIIPLAIYFSIRHCIKATWLNDSDQFLYPNDKWEKDIEFQNDCLAFMLFHPKNRITAKEGINHFIPFNEKEINAQEAFTSHFMYDFINGRLANNSKEDKKDFLELENNNIDNKDSKNTCNNENKSASAISNDVNDSKPNKSLKTKSKLTSKPLQTSLFNDYPNPFIPTKPLEFSKEAKEVIEAGKELFKHYHTQAKDSSDYNANASLYDIKAHFQGFSDNGRGKIKMNGPQKADDEYYKEKLGNLNYALKELAKKLATKAYEYGFLLP